MLFAAILTVAAPCTEARTVRYQLDPVHTRLVFFIEHFGFSKSIGTFSSPNGSLLFDEDDWTTAQLEVTIPIDSLDLGESKWNKKMLGSRWFNSKAHPQARYTSQSVTVLEDQQLKIDGELCLRGVCRAQSLLVRMNLQKRNALTLRQTIGFSATAQVSRSAFGMKGSPSLIGDLATLYIEVEAVRKNTDAATSAPASTADTDSEPDSENDDGTVQ